MKPRELAHAASDNRRGTTELRHDVLMFFTKVIVLATEIVKLFN